MGRSPCCDTQGLKKGAWTEEEDRKLVSYIRKHGEGDWRSLPQKAGLSRCGKSCRLRWANYLRPGVRRGEFSPEEEQTIIRLHAALGNKWAAISRHLYRRTDNEIKNYWNTRLKKRITEANITVEHSFADQNSTNVRKLINKPDQKADSTNKTQLKAQPQLCGTFLQPTEDNAEKKYVPSDHVNHVPSDHANLAINSSTSTSHRHVNKVAMSTSVHELNKVVTDLTPTLHCPRANGTLNTGLILCRSSEGTSTSSTTTSSANASTNIPDYEPLRSRSSSPSSAQVLNKIASKMGLLNLRRARADSGVGSPADGTSSSTGGVGEFPFQGESDLRSPATISSATSNNVEVILEDAALSQQTGLSEVCGDQLMCQQSVDFENPFEDFFSQSRAADNRQDLDDITDADIEQLLITSFFNGEQIGFTDSSNATITNYDE